jgi:hypothetical protein
MLKQFLELAEKTKKLAMLLIFSPVFISFLWIYFYV